MSLVIAGLKNQDSSFFAIKSKVITARVFNEDILTFTYDEENGRYSTGTLTVNDDKGYYADTLVNGAPVDISFGYASRDNSTNALLLLQKNPGQLLGGMARTGIQARISNPSGKAGSDGRRTFSCNFYGSESQGERKFRQHANMTKGTLVGLLLAEMEVPLFTIQFTEMPVFLGKNNAVSQAESNYQLLLRLAREWGAFFRISNVKGVSTAIFISPKYITKKELGTLMSGTIGGDSIFLEYGSGVGNVLEYSWKNNAGGSGQGDNVQIVQTPGGQPTFIRYVAKGDTVTAYKFHPELVEAKLRGAKNISDRTEMMAKFMKAENFEEVKWAFTPEVQPTAPQGLGYSMQVKMFGMPLMSAPLKVVFGKGFPKWFTPKSDTLHYINFYARKVSHSIDGSGYKMDLEIENAYSMFGGKP